MMRTSNWLLLCLRCGDQGRVAMVSAMKINKTVTRWLAKIDECISDASVTEASPRLRLGAAQDIAMLAAMILGGPERWAAGPNDGDAVGALINLRRSVARQAGLRRHVDELLRFDRGDYGSTWSHSDAARALKAARRISTSLRWRLLEMSQTQRWDSA
jgi:hypothetical protein